MKETFERQVTNKLAPKIKPTNSIQWLHFYFYELSCLSQTKKFKCSILITLLGNVNFFNQCYGVSPILAIPRLSVIWTLLDGWVIEKITSSIKARNKQRTSFFIKTLAQTLVSTKNQRCIQSLVKYLRRSSSADFARLPALWVKVIWFLLPLIR